MPEDNTSTGTSDKPAIDETKLGRLCYVAFCESIGSPMVVPDMVTGTINADDHSYRWDNLPDCIRVAWTVAARFTANVAITNLLGEAIGAGLGIIDNGNVNDVDMRKLFTMITETVTEVMSESDDD